MNRRHLLGLGALGLLGIWAVRPSDNGGPYDDYFSTLNQLLKQQGGGVPQLVVDMQRLDANAELLARRLGNKLPLRLVAKSLASDGLLDYLAKKLATRRFMAFHQPQLNQLARLFEDADLLLGKPLPVSAALAFYQQLGATTAFDSGRQVTWLIDTPQRLQQYAELSAALKQPLQIALEIDLGLARGGFSDPQALGEALNMLRTSQASLTLRGLMGYDAQVAHSPPWIGRDRAFADSNARYRAFIATAQTFTDLWPAQPLLNGAGSLTYALHARGDTPLNEVSVGSALLKPSEFDNDLLAEHLPALWIATPVLKAQTGELPYLKNLQSALQTWDRNRQQAYYLYGGRWQADPVAPAGLSYDSLYGRSANQERVNGSRATALGVDDWVFLRPQLSEGLLDDFAELRLLRNNRLVGRWLPENMG
jgi:D-serine deaminase-like pyridoxal phosphate-dependent protein